MSKRFKDYRRFKVYTWRPGPRPEAPMAGRRAGPDRRAARPAPAAPWTSPGQKRPEPPLKSRRRLGPPPWNNPRPCWPPLPPSLYRGPDAGHAAPTVRTVRPNPAASARVPTLQASAAPASRKEPCGPQTSVRRGGPCTGPRAPIAPIHETPSKMELACWPGGWEAGPYSL